VEYNYFDIIVSVVILFLGLKGIINGFFKELFGLLGIIGGIFIASRVGDDVGEYLSDLIFNFSSHAAVTFTGFLVTLAVFWLFMVVVGMLFKKLSSMSGLGIFDRILGFVFGASKFFLIAAVIAFSVYNIKAMRSTIDSTMKNSFMFPILVETGNFIMKIDPAEISDDVNETINDTIEDSKEAIKDTVDDVVESETAKIVKETKEEIKNSLEKNTSQEDK
jgi:membrane protein required for colicin V production